jgi:hypothetical protein
VPQKRLAAQSKSNLERLTRAKLAIESAILRDSLKQNKRLDGLAGVIYNV